MANKRATATGLTLALLGPLFVAIAASHFELAPTTFSRSLPWLLAMLALLASILAIVRWWERLPWSSLGFRRPTWRSFVWGLTLAAFFVLVFGPLVAHLFARLDSVGFDQRGASTANLPLWYLSLLIVVVGTMEEVLYRGYAIHRLADWTGSPLLGATISTAAFALAHVPMWGWVTSLSFVFSGGLLAAFFMWRRDIIANIIAHVLTDVVGIALPHIVEVMLWGRMCSVQSIARPVGVMLLCLEINENTRAWL